MGEVWEDSGQGEEQTGECWEVGRILVAVEYTGILFPFSSPDPTHFFSGTIACVSSRRPTGDQAAYQEVIKFIYLLLAV